MVVTEWNERQMRCGSIRETLDFQHGLVRDFIKRGCISRNERRERIDARLEARGVLKAECESPRKWRWWQDAEESAFEEDNDIEENGVHYVWTVCANNADAVKRAERDVTTKALAHEVKRLTELMEAWISHDNNPIGGKETCAELRKRMCRSNSGENPCQDTTTEKLSNPERTPEHTRTRSEEDHRADGSTD
jgi:hypothetical protein